MQFGVKSSLEVAVVHLHRLHPGGLPFGLDLKGRHAQVRMEAYGATGPVRDRVVVLEQSLASLGNNPTADHDQLGADVVEVTDELEVSQAGRYDRAQQVVDAVVERGVEAGHAVGSGRFDTKADGLAHVMVDVALVGQVLDVLVVGAETDVGEGRAQRVDVGENRLRVVVHRASHNGEHGAEPDPLEHLVDRDGVMVVAHPRSQVRPQGLVAQPGGVACDPVTRQQRLPVAVGRLELEVERVALAQGHGVGHPEPAQHLLVVHRCPAQLKHRERRGCRRDLLEDTQRAAGMAGPVHAAGPEDIGDAIGVGEHGRRAFRHDQASQLPRWEHCVLDMEVGVDEGGGDD